MNEKIREVCLNLGWDIMEYDEMIELQMFSPAGEDFSFSVDKSNFREDVIA